MNWFGKNTSYYPMVPGPSTVSKGAGHFLEMQLFFTCECHRQGLRVAYLIDANTDNTTEVFQNVSLTTAPGVWMAVYDASFDLVQMMADGQLYTAQIDANSHTVVNIGLEYYKYLNKTPNYKYGE